MKTICFLRGLWWNLRYPKAFLGGAWLSGHDFREAESNDPRVHLLKCKTCGYESAGYRW